MNGAVDAACLTDSPSLEYAGAGVVGGEGLSRTPGAQDAWQQIIDYKLIEWGRHPEAIEEDDLIPPTPEAIPSAIEVCRAMMALSAPPPKRVVPDGDGGVVLERWGADWSVSIEIVKDGTVELVELQQGRVQKRTPLVVGR
jgi:hypothetical protein